MKPKPYKAKSLAGAQAYARMLLKQQAKTQALLGKFAEDRRTLAKLAATGPAFYNPLDVWAAQKLRDEVLERECGLKPDGSPL